MYKFTKNLRVTSICKRCAEPCECGIKQTQYAEMLLGIGNGICNDSTVILCEDIDIPTNNKNSRSECVNNTNKDENDESIVIKLPLLSHILDKDEALKFTFPQLYNENDGNICEGNSNKSAILCATNEDVDEWNNKIQLMNPNPEMKLKSTDMFDYVDDPNGILKAMLNEHVLNRLKKNGAPPHILTLKVGDICFIMRNLLKKEGLTNNTRVKIIDIKKYSIKVHTIDTPVPKVFIEPRIIFKVTLPYGRSFTMVRKQFPLRLAYSMTYNKSQGQELKKCLVDIRSPPFCHGHLYVALSRIRHFMDIKIFCNQENIINNCIVLKNFVYNKLRI